MTYRVIDFQGSYAITDGSRVVISPLTRWEARETARLLNMYVAERDSRPDPKMPKVSRPEGRQTVSPVRVGPTAGSGREGVTRS